MLGWACLCYGFLIDVHTNILEHLPTPPSSYHTHSIGLSIHNIRSMGSYIRGTNGTSNGIIPMLRVFNDTARYVDQGGGKRKVLLHCYCRCLGAHC